MTDQRDQVPELLLESGRRSQTVYFRCSHDPAGVDDAEMPRLALSNSADSHSSSTAQTSATSDATYESDLAGPTREVERPARTRERDASAQARRTELAGARRVGSEICCPVRVAIRGEPA